LIAGGSGSGGDGSDESERAPLQWDIKRTRQRTTFRASDSSKLGPLPV